MFISENDNYYCKDCVSVRDNDTLPEPEPEPPSRNSIKKFFIRILGLKKEPTYTRAPKPVAEGAYIDNLDSGHCMFCNRYDFHLKYRDSMICNHCLASDKVRLYLC